MSLFIIEAAVIGIKEAVKLGAVWLVFSAFLSAANKQKLIIPFYLGVLLTLLISIASLFVQPGLLTGDVLVRLIGYTFFIFFLGSAAALYQSFGVRLLKLKGNMPLKFIIVLLTVFYFSPDLIGSCMFIRELSLMKEIYLPTYLSAAVGFGLSLALAAIGLRRFRGFAGRFFGIGQFLLFLSLVKLLGGGIKGFAELSLIPSVERGVMKFVHDVVHQIFVFLMVPDHPLLKTTVWNFIGVFFGSTFATAVVLLLLLAPAMVFLYHSFTSPVPEPAGTMVAAEKRKIKASLRADRRRKAVPVAIFICVVLVSWFSAKGERMSRLYNPKPRPVVEDKGTLVIPFTDPTMDIMDGRLYKFSLLLEEDNIVILVVRKPDGKLAACLDACEICPPEGYGQTEGEVICIYCMTPIPIETLGKPGGCNPIPLKAAVTDNDIRIDIKEIALKWQDVKTGKAKEQIR